MINDYRFENRKFVIVGIVMVIVLTFIGRLFYLQIINDDFKKYADSNAFLNKTIYPSRGVMYDRNGKLLVSNQPAYDVRQPMYPGHKSCRYHKRRKHQGGRGYNVLYISVFQSSL